MAKIIEASSACPPGQKSKSVWAKLSSNLGPGLVTGASDDDPSGIATYSQAGARFGFGTLWMMLFSYPLMSAIQEISAQIGCVTGNGIAGNLRRCYSRWLLYPIVGLLVIVNTINVGVDLGAMGSAAQLVFGGHFVAYCIGFALFSAIAQVFIPYHTYVTIIKWSTLALFAYVATAFSVHIPWGEALLATIVPRISLDSESLQMLIAILGTTISPYLFFWQASLEVEDQRLNPDAKPLKRAPAQAEAAFSRIRFDTYFGMGVSNLIAYFIILTTAVTLHAAGKTNVETAAQAAAALKPVAGNFCFLLFSIGMIGTGLLAVPVLAGSAAYAVGESFRWRTGLEMKPSKAPRFYAVIAAATLLGLLVNFSNINPIKALFWTAILNGIVAVPIMPMMMLMASNKKVMGRFVISRRLKILGWITTGVMTAAAIAMLVTL